MRWLSAVVPLMADARATVRRAGRPDAEWSTLRALAGLLVDRLCRGAKLTVRLFTRTAAVTDSLGNSESQSVQEPRRPPDKGGVLQTEPHSAMH